MDTNTLLEIRKQVVDGAQKIALEGSGAPVDRLQVLLEIIRSGTATKEIFDRSIQLINELEGDDVKLGNMLDLVYEIDQLLAAKEQLTTTTI